MMNTGQGLNRGGSTGRCLPAVHISLKPALSNVASPTRLEYIFVAHHATHNVTMPPRLMRLCLPGKWPPAFPGSRFSTTAHRAQKTSDPLRILFCGSDEFSIAALRALHQEHKANEGLIQSLDVVVRPGKPTGRGMKKIREGGLPRDV